jgi:hypothetical protein
MKKITFNILSIVASGMPILAFAAAPTDFQSLVSMFTDLIGILVIVVFGLTFVVFIWGIIKSWIINGGEAEGIKEGKHIVVVGIIAFVIMFSIWGILALLQTVFTG